MKSGECLKITVNKRVPSLNQMLRWSPWENLKEKREIQAEVALALESELEAIVSGYSTSTISTEASNISWIRSGMQKLYLMTTQKASRSKSRKRKSKTTAKRRRKWR